MSWKTTSRFGLLMTLLLPLGWSAGPVRAEVSVFACEPEWGALAREIGGDRVKVRVATTAKQDPHFIRARPSLIAGVRRADLVFCTGADLEVGWLPLLLRKAGNSNVQTGAVGNLAAANYVDKLEVPTSIDRSLGDIHPQGNPHIHTNPHNLLTVAGELTARLVKLDGANSEHFNRRFAAFEEKWIAAMAGWERKTARLRGLPVAVQHSSWVYLVDWLGLDVIVTLEPKPGIPPSAAHLEGVLKHLQTRPVTAVINAAYESQKPSQWLAERTGFPMLTLPYTVGGNDKAGDLFALFDDTVALLIGSIK